MTGKRIGIVGCGVAGMASAIACARDGWDVTVLERFETPRPVGAGLLLQPTGLAALDALGLRADVERAGARIAALDGRTAAGKPVLELVYAHWDAAAYGLGVHRGTLFAALHGALQSSGAALRLGAEITDVRAGADVTLIDAAGRNHGPFDLILVADGAHSTLRDAVIAKPRAPIFPWGALWTVRPDRHDRWGGALRQVYDGAHTMMGVLPVGRGPTSATREVAVFWSLRRDRYAAWRAGGLDAWRAQVARHWPAAARLLVGVTDPDELTFAIYRDVSAAPWRSGPMLLIGDAAHGTSPQLGQGANLALVDGVTIAACLRAHPNDLDAALRLFRRTRRGLTGWTQLMSRALTPAFQSDGRVIAWARDALLRDLTRFPPIERLMLATLVGAAALPLSPSPHLRAPANRLATAAQAS